MYSPTYSEFEAFPPTVKRKCFSTLERLRLAQSYAAVNSCGGPCNQTRKARKGLSRPSIGSRPKNLYYSSNGQWSKRSKRSPVTPEFSQEDAQLFQRLPEKIQRKQFSIQEQAVLGGRHDSVIVDAADEAVYKLGGRQANRSLPSLFTSSSNSSVLSIETEDLVSPSTMDDSMMDSFRWLEEDDNLDLTLDDYHTHVAESAVPSKEPSSRRPSFRRHLSLTSLPFGRDARSSIDRNVPLSDRTFNFPPSSHQSNILSPSVSSKSTTQPPTQLFEPSATHYQDPEARLKLRVYLASPQKFDEAIEFGFPSLQNPSKPSSRRPSFAAAQKRRPSAAADVQTFFEDDNDSLFRDQDETDTASLPDIDSPDTPQDPVFRTTPRALNTKQSSTDMRRPQIWQPGSEPYAHTWAGDREMTLRMTLTRPDLRADESVLYPKGDDPLALEDLPPGNDGGDIWTKGGKEGGLVKKLWRRVSGKN